MLLLTKKLDSLLFESADKSALPIETLRPLVAPSWPGPYKVL